MRGWSSSRGCRCIGGGRGRLDRGGVWITKARNERRARKGLAPREAPVLAACLTRRGAFAPFAVFRGFAIQRSARAAYAADRGLALALQSRPAPTGEDPARYSGPHSVRPLQRQPWALRCAIRSEPATAGFAGLAPGFSPRRAGAAHLACSARPFRVFRGASWFRDPDATAGRTLCGPYIVSSTTWGGAHHASQSAQADFAGLAPGFSPRRALLATYSSTPTATRTRGTPSSPRRTI